MNIQNAFLFPTLILSGNAFHRIVYLYPNVTQYILKFKFKHTYFCRLLLPIFETKLQNNI
jgi:hypothetical protein